MVLTRVVQSIRGWRKARRNRRIPRPISSSPGETSPQEPSNYFFRVELICSQPVNVDSMRTKGESVLESLRKKDKKRKGGMKQDTCLTFTPACIFIAMKENTALTFSHEDITSFHVHPKGKYFGFVAPNELSGTQQFYCFGVPKKSYLRGDRVHVAYLKVLQEHAQLKSAEQCSTLLPKSESESSITSLPSPDQPISDEELAELRRLKPQLSSSTGLCGVVQRTQSQFSVSSDDSTYWEVPDREVPNCSNPDCTKIPTRLDGEEVLVELRACRFNDHEKPQIAQESGDTCYGDENEEDEKKEDNDEKEEEDDKEEEEDDKKEEGDDEKEEEDDEEARARFMADLLMLKIVVGGMARNKCSADKVLAAVHSLLASNLITFPTCTTLASPIPTLCMDPKSTLEQIEDDSQFQKEIAAQMKKLRPTQVKTPTMAPAPGLTLQQLSFTPYGHLPMAPSSPPSYSYWTHPHMLQAEEMTEEQGREKICPKFVYSHHSSTPANPTAAAAAAEDCF